MTTLSGALTPRSFIYTNDFAAYDFQRICWVIVFRTIGLLYRISNQTSLNLHLQKFTAWTTNWMVDKLIPECVSRCLIIPTLITPIDVRRDALFSITTSDDHLCNVKRSASHAVGRVTRPNTIKCGTDAFTQSESTDWNWFACSLFRRHGKTD